MPTIAVSVREAPAEMNRSEMWRRAKDVVDAIDHETGTRTARSQRVERLYRLGLDIQEAKRGGAKDITVHGIIKFLMRVLAQSYGFNMAPAR